MVIYENFHMTTITNLFTNQSEVSALPARCLTFKNHNREVRVQTLSMLRATSIFHLAVLLIVELTILLHVRM